MKSSVSLTAVAALLSTAVLSSAAYIYSCGDSATFIAFTLISAVYTATLFLIFELLRRKNKVIITTIVVISLFIVVGIISISTNDLRFFGDIMQWFMSPKKFSRIYPGAIASVTLTVGFILDAAMFYFTKVQFRAVYIFLICMCPFSLFAKTFTDIPVLYTVIVTTLFFTLLIVSGGSKNDAGSVSKGIDISKILAFTGFVAVVTIISAFSPKLEYAPYRKEFDELITGMQIGANSGFANYNDFSQSSSNIGSDSSEKGKVVFRVYGDAPGYIKRQCFNYYDGVENEWTYYGDANHGSADWRLYSLFEDPSALYEVSGYNGGETFERECAIVSADDKVRALYTQENTLDLRFEEGLNITVYRSELSEYFLLNGLARYPTGYVLKWADFEVDPNFSTYFSDGKANELSSDNIAVKSYILARNEAKKHDSYLLSEEVRESCYKNRAGMDEIRKLTAEITADCSNDYEKAKAIEQYFKSSDFFYDESFVTSDASPENFILRTKRGVCGSYATAMTLMCREAGLTARYVEGFLRGDYSAEDRCYLLTVGDAHAYVQVWIDGYGWTDFDPTSNNIGRSYTSTTFLFIGLFAVLLALLVVTFIFIAPKISRAMFVKRLKAKSGRAKYIYAYERVNSLYNGFAGLKENSLTPSELAEKSMEELNYDISGFISEYERCVYGNDESALSSDCVSICSEYLVKVRTAEKERKKALKAARKGKKPKMSTYKK